MSFLKSLFGGGSSKSGSASQVIDEAVHEGFTIKTLEMKEGSQFRVHAEISKAFGDEVRTHKLIRADICGTAEEASTMAMQKAKQIIKEGPIRED